jgi:hypothetical protein
VILDEATFVDNATELTTRALTAPMCILCAGFMRAHPTKLFACTTLGLVCWWLHCIDVHDAICRNVAQVKTIKILTTAYSTLYT